MCGGDGCRYSSMARHYQSSGRPQCRIDTSVASASEVLDIFAELIYLAVNGVETDRIWSVVALDLLGGEMDGLVITPPRVRRVRVVSEPGTLSIVL